jgi:hypothetical protein
MKIFYKFLFMSALLLVHGVVQANCDDGASVRSFNGPTETVQSFWRELKRSGVPTWGKGSFHRQEFNYIGLIKSNQPLHVVWFYTEWGQSCRATNRLLLFSKNGKFIGSYSGVGEPSKIVNGNTLQFLQIEPVSFSSGPPLWLDSNKFETASKWALTTQSRGPP